MGKRLTMNQEKFCQEYVTNGQHAGKAIVKAHTLPLTDMAHNMGCANLNKPHIQERIKILSQSIAEKSLSQIESGALLKAVKQAERTIEHVDTCIEEKCNKCKDAPNARRFLLDVARSFTQDDEKSKEHKHLHLSFPKRR